MSHTELATQSQLYAGPGGILCEARGVQQTGLMVREDECQLVEVRARRAPRRARHSSQRRPLRDMPTLPVRLRLPHRGDRPTQVFCAFHHTDAGTLLSFKRERVARADASNYISSFSWGLVLNFNTSGNERLLSRFDISSYTACYQYSTSYRSLCLLKNFTVASNDPSLPALTFGLLY